MPGHNIGPYVHLVALCLPRERGTKELSMTIIIIIITTTIRRNPVPAPLAKVAIS